MINAVTVGDVRERERELLFKPPKIQYKDKTNKFKTIIFRNNI